MLTAKEWMPRFGLVGISLDVTLGSSEHAIWQEGVDPGAVVQDGLERCHGEEAEVGLFKANRVTPAQGRPSQAAAVVPGHYAVGAGLQETGLGVARRPNDAINGCITGIGSVSRIGYVHGQQQDVAGYGSTTD